MCAGTSTSFEGTAIHEGRFRVVISNSGTKLHANPNPVNYAGLQVRCEQQGCNKVGKYLYRVCGARKHKFLHTTDWVGLLRPDDGVLGQPVKIPVRRGAPIINVFAPAHSATSEYLVLWMGQDSSRQVVMDKFIDGTLDAIVGKIPDATTLQSNFEANSGIQPDDVIQVLSNVIDRTLPESQFSNSIIENVRLRVGKDVFDADMPLRVVATLLITGFACEESNRGDLWYRIKHNFKPDEPRMASAYMPVVYYLLRRHTRASPTQAQKSLRA